jgi:uncharacterized protein YjiS (DUF1127 family)
MTATFAAFFAPAAAHDRAPLARRLVEALIALDAGHRAARKLAEATDERLADMGITRTEAEIRYRRDFGGAAPRHPQFPGW